MKKLVDILTQEFIDWAFNHSPSNSQTKYEIAQEVWIEKGLEIYRLKKQIEKLKEKIETLESK